MENTNEELERIQRELLEEDSAELERIQRELLAEDFEQPQEPPEIPEAPEQPQVSMEDTQILNEIMVEFSGEPTPAFDDPDKLEFSDEPVVYCNYSNDYGKDLQQEAEKAEALLRKKKKQDTAIITLMSVSVGLCAGIISVLIYWLLKYLK
jgi:hypothetical protein